MADLVDLVAQWIQFKGDLLASSGIDRSVLQIYGAIGGLLLIAFVTRRPLASPLPWLTLLFLAAMNESATIVADRFVEDRELAASLHDMAVAMAVPTLLFLLARFAPAMIVRPVPRWIEWRQHTPATPQPALRPAEAIDDAEYEDMEQDERGDWRPVRRVGG